MILQEAPTPYGASLDEAKTMIRTQIYLTRAEHEFLQSEANRRSEPMAAVVRGFIDEKMQIPDDAWTNNSMLQPTVDDPNYVGREDGSLNHDYYVSGGSKKYKKIRGKWVLKAENET